jgi:hypothetical protein
VGSVTLRRRETSPTLSKRSSESAIMTPIGSY